MAGYMLQLQLLITICCLTNFILSSNYDLITERVECVTSKKDICANTQCTTRPINRHLTVVDIGCFLTDEVDDIMARVTLYYKYAEYRKFLIDMEENACNYLKNKKSTTLINVLMPQIINASNIRSCPIKGDVLIKGLDINSKNNPPGLPAGQYRLDILISSKRRPIITIKLYILLKPKGAVQL